MTFGAVSKVSVRWVFYPTTFRPQLRRTTMPGHSSSLHRLPITAVEKILIEIRHNPMRMCDIPLDSQIPLLTILLDDEEPDIFVLLVSSILSGPQGMVEFLAHLAHNPDLRQVAVEQAFSTPTVTILSDKFVEVVLKNQMVQAAIDNFRQITAARPVFQSGSQAEA